MAIAITLKDVLDGDQGQQDLSTILNKTTSQIKKDISRKKSSAHLGNLQKNLNNLFYPKQSTSFSQEYYQALHADASVGELKNILENFNFENNTSGYHPASVAISPHTLENSINEAQTVYNLISSMDSLMELDTIQSLMKQARSIIQKGNNILKNAERSLQFKNQERIVGEDFEKAIVIVNQLKALASLIRETPTPQEAGIIFEKALAKTNFIDKAGNSTVSELIEKEILKKTHTGGSPVVRGVNQNKISYVINSQFKDDKMVTSDSNFVIDDKNLKITYSYNPNEQKQGKMDVQLKYGNRNSKNYRVSAKRWTGGVGDLGHTSIDAGMTRAVGISVMEAYKLAVLTPSQDWGENGVPSYTAVDYAHELAKIALKSDIAMGLNQKTGYANILVVDTGSSIVVKDLASIVESAKLSGYSNHQVENSAVNLYDKMKNITSERTQTYLGLMSSVLNKMKVTIYESTIKKG